MRKIFIVCLMAVFSVGAMAATRGPIDLKVESDRTSILLSKTKPTQELCPFAAFQYPDEIVISSELLIIVDVTVRIYNACGQVVESLSQQLYQGDNIYINIENLPSEHYIIEISFNQTVCVGEFEN